MKLDRWIIVETKEGQGNTLVGYVYDCPQFSAGQRIMTEAIRFINPLSMEAECLDGKYRLMDPGTVAEHNLPLIGKKPESVMPKIDTTIFINPKG